MHVVASEARSIEMRLAKSDWVVGESVSAADIVIFPGLQTLLRALAKPDARELSSRFLPLEINYPALARWIAASSNCPATSERTHRTGAPECWQPPARLILCAAI